MSIKINQKGVLSAPVILGIVAVGILVYIVFTNLASFKTSPASSLYTKEQSQAAPPGGTTGSGAPSGAHYNLNIIGVPKGKTADMTSGQGHRIFVPLEGNCKINLSEGDFQVLDGNCTDGPAAFQLPNPDPENDGVTEYSVYARALGKPGGRSTTTTCATDPITGEEWCSVYSMVLVREKGKSSFTNVSKVLLYVYADINGDGELERYPLFDSALQDYFWNYDNNGLKLAQLRFYQISTNVN
ncbi:hypothetical protein A3F00_04680 [Candidatus Daviesbacteria bacterium RIFCSPHIGHO2_12_FULL_37_11]|uniref:Uncharacterized protein n=1 Tax=Candidatus Daviesbacteria bacterium RIFCSPHIGHO2_12_FULL_37_11 TaxID=1797777 RepID=A0A1F5KEE7_9BACT|nr:MAG: hypothetical protein A2769_02455 [Candidatus Daviesbacteria bacterium RIFCSPHIGHO2_01_FULL_37_27]OGE39170.1 MAG: hypothetical protein A3F00_04680 [Candidatus Daviesbacteria bacterium RIFCSPHIGHO2_12_FULL_37_11]OGE45600.1 MAG: hypothetical protein A3B39_02245 [Candidatus Daviesbacteria bacterium RIFCSPLOWO2_01_FULL_37_10]